MPAQGDRRDPGRTAVVFAGGDPLDAAVAVPEHDLAVAADSGVHEALARGVDVTVVVGDLDSVAPEALDEARRRGAIVEQHPPDKDATDLELALDAARARDARRIVVLGGGGGRLDHLLGNLLLLGSSRYADLDIGAHLDGARLWVVRGGSTATLCGRPGQLVSLLPLGGAAEGIRTSGLRFPLDDESLEPGTTRGISNELAAPEASVSLGAGTLLVVRLDEP